MSRKTTEEGTDRGSARLTRRSVLAALGGVSAVSLHELFTPRSSGAAPRWCPSEAEMQSMSWLRGRFEKQTKDVVPGAEVESTLKITNGGGERGTYRSTVWLVKREEMTTVEKQPAASVSVDVPARSTSETTIVVNAPARDGQWELQAPRLASSCDVLRPAVQMLTFVDGESDG